MDLIAELDRYKHLDDYEYYRNQRLKQNAMKKYVMIIQSVNERYKDCLHRSNIVCSTSIITATTTDDSSNTDSEITQEPAIDDLSNFNKIIKRHKRRILKNQSQFK